MKKVKYNGNLIRYSVSYNGIDHIFSEVNHYTLEFNDEFALNLTKDTNLFSIVDEKSNEKNGDKYGMPQQKKQTENNETQTKTETKTEKINSVKKLKE